MRRARLSWLVGFGVSASIAGYLTWALAQPSARVFLPGRTSDGHHQIEDACRGCHTPFGGVEQDACLRCHGRDLEEARDSHPPSKFTDPRNAQRTSVLDAAHCVTCHREHRHEMTRPMAVTVPDDVCFRCHAEIGRERPSHASLTFDTCSSGGCHNFHDNRALYLDFLVRGAGQPATLADARVPLRTRTVPTQGSVPAVDAPAAHRDPDVERAWLESGHAATGVGCMTCHSTEPSNPSAWEARPGPGTCGRCHAPEQGGFLAGKHGMRLAAGLTAMRPELARLPMRSQAAHRQLGCGSCHDPHRTDTVTAAVEACEGCHDDPHTRAYRGSAHFRLWGEERRAPQQSGLGGTGVSCATCHLPRHEADGRVVVEHNQNANLRPNEKMLRQVCQRCHGLAFSLDAMADAALVRRNFAGPPPSAVESIRMALDRQGERDRSKRTKEKE